MRSLGSRLDTDSRWKARQIPHPPVHPARLFRPLDHLRHGRDRRAAGLRPGPVPGRLRHRGRTRRARPSRGVEVSEVFHGAKQGADYQGSDEPFLFGTNRVSGPDPDRGSYRSFASFRDPDGNGWLFQEVTTH